MEGQVNNSKAHSKAVSTQMIAIIAAVAGLLGGSGGYYLQWELNPPSIVSDPDARPDAWTRTDAMNANAKIADTVDRLVREVVLTTARMETLVDQVQSLHIIISRGVLPRTEERLDDIERRIERLEDLPMRKNQSARSSIREP